MPIKLMDVLPWITEIIVGIFTAMVFSYSTFESKVSAKDKETNARERDGVLEKRLDRIENKIDLVIGRQK